MDPTIIPAQIISDEMAQLDQYGITIKFNNCIVDLDYLDYVVAVLSISFITI